MDIHLDVSRKGYGGGLEVIEGPTGRRRRSASEKARIVAEVSVHRVGGESDVGEVAIGMCG